MYDLQLTDNPGSTTIGKGLLCFNVYASWEWKKTGVKSRVSTCSRFPQP